MIHHGVWRLRTNGDPISPDAIAIAKRCVGIAQQAWEFQRPGHFVRPFRFSSGLEVDVLWDGTLWICTVREPAPTPTAVQPTPRPTLWVPHGFLLYPASDTSPIGWGAPAVAVGDDPYAEANLRPGLVVSRWTPGGLLGQVLVTQLPNAGYPPAATGQPPLLFHREFGPRPATDDEGEFVFDFPEESGAWSAYRLEHEDYRDSLDAPAAWKRTIFELTNARRQSIGSGPVMLPLRGYYDSAQVTTDQMVQSGVMGHFAEQFDPTYRSGVDRLSKDGVTYFVAGAEADSRNTGSFGKGSENIYANSTTEMVEIGEDPNGIPILEFTPGPLSTPQSVFDAWMASPIHGPNIDDPAWGIGDTSLLIGARAGAATQHFLARQDWIAAGNRAWFSDHDDVPVVSWLGFLSETLGYETWPVRFRNDLVTTSPPSANYIEMIYPGLQDADGLFYLRYLTRPLHEGHFESPFLRLAMESRLFCRGRAIAVAPRGGLIWSAAVQRIEGAHRIVILTHEDADQPTDPVINGLTSILRVWYCDVEDLSILAANAESVIRGVYGTENEGFPWDDVNSAFSWRGGATVDVGSSDGMARDLLKYTSVWRFNGAGTKAICLRDWIDSQLLSDVWYGMSQAQGFNNSESFRASALVLDVLDPEVPTLQWLGADSARQRNEPLEYWPDPLYPTISGWRVESFPIAIDWQDNDTPICCLGAKIFQRGQNPAVSTTCAHIVYGWGAYEQHDIHSWDGLIELSSQPMRGDDTQDVLNAFGNSMRPLVLSVRLRAVIWLATMNKVGVRPEPANPSGRALYNVPEAFCWADGGNAVQSIRMMLGTTQVFHQWVSVNDNATYSLHPFANVFGEQSGGPYFTMRFGVHPIHSMANWALPQWAEDRAGNWVCSVTVCAQPLSSYWIGGNSAWLQVADLYANMTGVEFYGCRGAIPDARNTFDEDHYEHQVIFVGDSGIGALALSQTPGANPYYAQVAYV